MSTTRPDLNPKARLESPRQSGQIRTLTGPLHDARAEASRCIQCGFCLPACPTYKVFGQEKHSPRGRIQLVKSWAEEQTVPEADLLAALDLCLDCRACETACPIDIRYGEIITGARDEVADGRAAGEIGGVLVRIRQYAMKMVLRHVVAKPRRIRFFGKIAHGIVHSRIGKRLDAIARRRPHSWFGAAFSFARAIPRPPTPSSDSRKGGFDPVQERGESSRPIAADRIRPAPRAALFLGCAQQGLFPETNRATTALLQRAGFDVDVPAGQACCGALHRHNGDKEFARRLVMRNMHAFGALDEDEGYDVIATNAGGCLAWIKEAAGLFPPDSVEHRAARRLAEMARDISEIIFDTSLAAADASGDTMTQAANDGARTGAPKVIYQPSCHLSHVCGVNSEPIGLLCQLHGDDVTLPPDGGSCCGSAGIYNALHPQASRDILERKMDSVDEVRPDVIVTSNPGCHLQMLAGMRARDLDSRVRVIQLADWLHEHKQAVPPLGKPTKTC